MTAKPTPYPADTRARGWRFELDMERARQSDTWAIAPADARPWLLMLWAVAWEQTPCGSLPNDDELIAARIGIPAKLFAKHRAILLRKWWAAEDGRLYHDVLVLRVTEMMQTRRKESDRKALARARDAARSTIGQPKESGAVPPMSHGTTAGLHPESDTGTGTGTGTKEVKTGCGSPQSADPPTPPPDFDGKNAAPLNGKAIVPLAASWELPEPWGIDAEALGWKPGEVLREAEKFRQYWTAGRGLGTRRSVKGWRQTWSTWLEKAAKDHR